MPKKLTIMLVAAAVFVGAVAGSWFLFKSRVINVWVYTDYTFRYAHSDWPSILTSRFNEVNRMFQQSGTAVRWKVLDASGIDPTRDIPGLDSRRATMALHFDHPADVFVVFTGVHEGKRAGSVDPFTRVAVVVDFPDKPEPVNAHLLGYELARLFGASVDAARLDAIMSDKPEAATFSSKTGALIRRMRDYPFMLGVDPISQDPWQKKALQAIAEDDSSGQSSPMAHAHEVIGMSLLNERKRDAALAQLKQAMAADPKNKPLRLTLIEAYTQNGQEDQALREARELVTQSPDDPLSHRAVGALLARNHQPEAAVRELQIAVQMEPNNAADHVMLGMELASLMGHVDDGIAQFEQALRLNPDVPRGREGLEKAQALKQAVAATLERERQAVRTNPSDPNANYLLAKAEAQIGDLKSAVRDFQKSAELQPTNGTPHMELAQVYLAAGDPDNAWEEVRKARQLGSEPPPWLLARLPAHK